MLSQMDSSHTTEGARRLPSRVALMLVLAVVLALIVPATAHAAVITKNWRVQPKGVVGAGVPVIVNGSGSFDAYPLSLATLELRVDGAVIPPEDYSATTPFTRNLYVYYAPSPQLADGPHTFRVQIADTLGRVSAYEWGATVAQPPTIAWTSPEADAEIHDGRPGIALTLADNTPTTAFALAGEVRSGSPAGAVVATFGTTGLAAGEQSFALTDELAPGTYYLTATVTDDAGNAAALTGTAARRFTSVAAPAMTLSPASCLDAGCHTDAAHPATGMACADCHVAVYHEYAECQDCHGGHDGPVTVTGIFGDCTVCHDPAYPWVPAHTAASVTPAHMSSCDGCHDESLLVRHAIAPSGSAYSYQCDICHGSTDPRVAAAVAAGDASCSACHDAVPGHGFDEAAHVAEIDTLGLTGTWSYAEPTAQVSGTLMNVPYAYSDEACLGCHDAQIAGPTGEHSKASASSAAAGCAACHPSPRDAVGVWDGTCTACHASADVHTSAGLSAAHSLTGDPAATGSCGFVHPTNGRRPCHYLDIVQEHNRLINPQIGVANKALSVTCAECHSNPVTVAALADGWDGTCTDCHDGVNLPSHAVVGSDRYLEVYALHNNPSGYYDSGETASSGVPMAGYNAMDAHGPVRVNTLGGANQTIGCGAPTCHTSAYIGGGWPSSAGPACAECHGPNVAPVSPYQGSYAWYSDTWSDGESLGTELTMTLDPMTLPAGSVLEFMTFYDIETDWDYGYVEISTDGGANWTALAGALTTTYDPYGQNLGNGITGSTVGEWVPAEFDLSSFAGQTVMIRFSYQCDAYVYGHGWMLDVISVGPEGAPIFSDDVETVDPAWSVSLDPTTGAGWSRYTP